jgi:ABC-2 type transport system permease protein
MSVPAVARRYAKTVSMSMSGHLGENPLVLADAGLKILRVVLLVAVWRTILVGGGRPFEMTLDQVLTYTLAAGVLAPMLDVRSGLPQDLWQGTIAFRFVRPMPVFGQYAAELAGEWAFRFVVLVPPLVLVAGVLGVSARPRNPVFVVSLVLAVVVGLAIDFAFGAVMVLLEQNWHAIHMIRMAVATVLSGALLPLAAYPWGLGRIFAWLPFASTASAPLLLYVGEGDARMLIGRQLMWAVLLWPVARHLWSRYRQRLVLYGG